MPMTPDYSNRSWIQDGSPTTAELWETHHVPPLPKRRLDMEMFSPPASPTQYHHRRSPSSDLSPGVFPFSPDLEEFEHQKTAPILLPDSTLDVFTTLEDSVSCFPDTTLMHDTPCVARVRALLDQSDSHLSQKPPPQLLPPFNPDAQHHRASAQHRRRVTFSVSTPRRHDLWSMYPANPRLEDPRESFRSPQAEPAQPAALQALRRIFPGCGRSASALYAYILAYIFVSDLQSHHDTEAFAELYDYQRFSSNVPPKAAGVLGIYIAEPVTRNSFGDVLDASRITRLEEGLEVCICRLVQVMRDAPDRADYLDAEFLRSLVEVVRACEMPAC
jgi:hypothetical protein